MAAEQASPNVSRRRALFIWALCCALAGGVFLTYALVSLSAGRGDFLLPLDDVYIHFQYARQLAHGQPYVYNPGLPASSGATSFLYPYLLAIGVLLGFDGLTLGLWALGIGALALAGSTFLIYKLARLYAPEWAALLVAFLFPLTGSVAWHFMSGMETGLTILFVLLTLYNFLTGRLMRFVVGAALLALVRPEGGALAGLAVAAYALRLVRRTGLSLPKLFQRRAELAWLTLPLLALLAQPLVNLSLTGSVVASGNQAKSVFAMVPPYQDAIIAALWGNFSRTGSELLTGFSPREGTYYPVLLSALALVGLLSLLIIRSRRLNGLVILAWFLAGIVAVATLDTAFWHFKRYHLPLIALLFPLAAWGLAAWPRRSMYISFALAGLTAIWTLTTATPFYAAYALNVDYVYREPLQMARWLAANTEPDAVIAVHDTGMMRYMGQRTTIDMVGLTTAGAASSWRSGPGAVAEFLDRARPDTIASYGRGHGFGLDYLAGTSLYADELARYDVPLDPNFNVALAADYQGIYQPDWIPVTRGERPLSPGLRALLAGASMVEVIDVADLASERVHHYTWADSERMTGFATEVYELSYAGCGADCRVMDGGRRINGEEAFDIVPPEPGQALLLVTRIYPGVTGTFDVYAGDTRIATRWIPAIPGLWLDIPTSIPGEFVTVPTRIRIVPHTPGGHYMPYHHWLYALDTPVLPDTAPFATFQNSAIRLYAPQIDVNGDLLTLNLMWGNDGNAQGDAKIFVHVVDEAGMIVAQADTRPGYDSLPPGNWIAGALADAIVVNLADVPPGHYRVWIGLYDPATNTRLTPTGGDGDDRLDLGEIEITGDG